MRFVFTKRFLALATPLAGVAALVLIIALAGSAGGITRILATGPTPAPAPDLTGVSCADIYLDSGFPGAATGLRGDINGDSVITDADITSMTMSRTEPSVSSPGNYDVTTVSYLGKAPAVALGLLGALVAGGPPAPVSPTNMTCQDSRTAAATSAEANRFGGLYETPYANQYGVRPTAIGTYTDIPAGNGHLTFSTCSFSEAQGAWVRIDSDTHITKTGKGSANDGVGTLYLGAGAPSSGGVDTNGDTVIDATTAPTTCAQTGFAYHFVFTSYGRNARTDHWATSMGLCGTDQACQANIPLGIALEADGPNTPKTKGTDQVADTSDGLADDWDGDGCPDWDELDRGFMAQTPAYPPLHYPPVYTWSTNPVNGTDPFNPYDCDSNWTSTISLTTTVGHNTATTSPYGNGFYFRCLGSVTQDKTGTPTQALAFKLGCYSDTTVTVINTSNPLVPYDASLHEGGGPGAATCGDTIDNDSNGKTDAADSSCHNSTCPPAPSYMCGDGRADSPPPGCVANPANATWCADATAGTCPTLPCPTDRFAWTGIDPTTYPVVSADPANNYYNPVDNTIHLGGCFAGFGGGTFGNVYGASTIDAHTGAGSFQIYLNQVLGDCTGGTPQGAAVNGTVTIVELRTEKGLTDAQKYDSDRDGCADARELGNGTNAQTSGGFRDPYNPNDYFNPEKLNTPNGQTVADILKTVQQFNKHQFLPAPPNPPGTPNPAYTTTTDRTAVVGGQSWSLGSPNGQQTVADILAAVKQFNHNCPGVTP